MRVLPPRPLLAAALAALLAGAVAGPASAVAEPAPAQQPARAEQQEGTGAASRTAALVPITVLSTVSYQRREVVQVVGEYRNDGAVVARQPAMQLELLDAGGAVLTRAVRYADTISPGDTRPYFHQVEAPTGFASARVVGVTAEQSDRVPNTSFEAAVTGVERGGISGTAKNLSNVAVKPPYVRLVMRDPEGRLYDVEAAYAFGAAGVTGLLQPGETAPFFAQLQDDSRYVEGGTVTPFPLSQSPQSPYPSELSVTSPARVTAGQVARVEARVRGRQTTGIVPTPVTVELLGREAGQTAYRVLRRTTENGCCLSWDVKPVRDVRLLARVVATSGVLPSTSAPVLTQASYAVSVTSTSGSRTNQVRATVRPAAPGTAVQLQRLSGGVWRTVQTGRLSGGSAVVFSVRQAKGRAAFRVHKPASGGTQAGTSARTVLVFP